MEKRKILVVDDESRMRKLVRDFLVKQNFEVLEAGDGEEALDVFYKNKDIALIILYVMMPKMNGFNTLKKLKANAKTSKIPVIMLSALIQEENKKQALSLGAARYLSKSEVKPMDVVQVVASLLK